MELQPEVNNTSRAMSLPSILNQLLSLIPHDEICFVINSELGSFGSELQFSKIMGVALDEAIKEIILPVVERSVRRATRTTTELVLEDYATESDYNTANRAARLMVGTLAGRLAHVTCKEPLCVALSSHLRSHIQNLTSNSETVEQVIHILINDNLDLGCASIGSVATRKAVESIDCEISAAQQRVYEIEALIAKDGKDGEIQVLSSQTNKEEDTTLVDSIAFQDQVSENPSAVGGCCWKSSYMGVLRFSTRLQPRHFRPSTVRGTPSKKLKKSIKRLNANIFQSNLLLKYKQRISLLQNELQKSINLISKEQYEISLIHNVQKSRASSFVQKFDKIMSMEKTCKENDKLLKKIQTGLLLNFDRTDSLLSEVKEIQTEHKAVSNSASRLASRVYDYRGRIDVELSWLSKFVNTIKVFSSKFAAITLDIEDFQNYLLELSQSIDEIVSWDYSSHDYMSHLYALRSTLRIWESTNLSIKYSAILLEVAADICLLAKNWRSIYREKTDLAERFQHAELDVEQNGPKLEKSFSRLEPEVDRVNRLYVKKLGDIPNDEQRSDTSSHIFQTVISDLFSWRVRTFNNRNIAPSIRTQGRGECSSVSTVSGTESLYKKQHAATINFGGQVYQAQEFTINLSHNHLQDIVAQFFEAQLLEAKQGKGKNKLEVCLEQMVEKGVLSESAYNNGDVEVQDSRRYRINGFEEINEAGFEEACDRLQKGDVLIGNFYITKDYYRLGPDDIYDIPPDAIIETTPSGHKICHCVVIVGFGVAPDGSGYYVYQNSYGPNWGSGGYGRVSSRSLKYLYSPTLA